MILYTEFNFSDLYFMCILESCTYDNGPLLSVGNVTYTNVYSYYERETKLGWHKDMFNFELSCKTYYKNLPLKKLSLVDFLWEIVIL